MRSRLSLVLAASLATSCSLGNVPSTACTSSAECREAFGFGHQCGADSGYCEPLSLPARCDRVFPENLLTAPEVYEDVVLFGALFDLSTDEDNVRSIELAFEEANIDDGLNGRPVGLITCSYGEDLAIDPEPRDVAAQASVEWLADHAGALGVLGPAGSQLVTDIYAEYAAPRDVFVMSPSATSDELIDIHVDPERPDAPDLFWRTAPTDSAQAAAIAYDIEGRGNTNVAVVYQTGAYGTGLANLLEPALSIPAARRFTFANSNQLTAAIADVALVDGLEEVIFVSSDTDDIASFLNGALQLPALAQADVFLTDAARSQSMLQSAAAASALFPNIRGTNPVADPNSAPQVAFYIAYRAKYGEDADNDSFNAFSYDAAWLSLYATAWADSQSLPLTGSNVAEGMRQLSSGTPVPLRAASWSTVLEIFANGGTVDVAGASGDLDYDPVTGETTAPIAVWTINGAGNGFVNERVCYPAGCEPFVTP